MKKKPGANPSNQFEQAVSALQQGRFRQAQRQLEQLLPLVEAYPVQAEQVHLALADACLSLRELPQAIDHAGAVLELNPENDQAHYVLGFAYSAMEEWDRAVEALQQAAELAPENAEYYRSLGWAIFNQGDAAWGQSLLEQALEKAPTHIPILTDLAMVHARAERFDQALVYARRAAELAPDDPRAQEVFAVLPHFQSEYERLGGSPPQEPARPSTEAEWRELIAVTGSFQDLIPLWFELHPAQDLDEANQSLQNLQELWNSTPRPELGGRSPNDMLGPGR
jgi:tetratricopeptide (TPR) repeat protein